jgi:glutaredoxin
MKNLIKKNNVFYLSDDTNTKNGITRKVTNDYKITSDQMPHVRFKNYIVIYGRYTCPYCIGLIDFFKTKPELDRKTIFVEVDMDQEPMLKKSKLLETLKNEIGAHSTVPIVFDKGKFIGGSTDTKLYYS